MRKEVVMKERKEMVRGVVVKPFYIRTLTRSGNSRYLSIGTILPPEWVAVKVFVERREEGVCALRLEQIK